LIVVRAGFDRGPSEDLSEVFEDDWGVQRDDIGILFGGRIKLKNRWQWIRAGWCFDNLRLCLFHALLSLLNHNSITVQAAKFDVIAGTRSGTV
jgi:hypothetical protein